MKACSTFRRCGSYFLHPLSQTTNGVWILREPILQLPAECANEDLGAALRTALAGSEQAVPHPDLVALGELAKPLHRAAGVKSLSAFMKGVTEVEATQDGPAITLVATVNLGTRGGFQPIEDDVVIDDPTDEELGAAIRAAHDRST